jgi:hypothetical protein
VRRLDFWDSRWGQTILIVVAAIILVISTFGGPR